MDVIYRAEQLCTELLLESLMAIKSALVGRARPQKGGNNWGRAYLFIAPALEHVPWIFLHFPFLPLTIVGRQEFHQHKEVL
jgi:hypothetical protein